MSEISNGYTLSELRRAVTRIEKEMDKKIDRMEELVEKHEERHNTLNRMLMVVFLTAVFNLGGVLISGLVK